METERIWKEIEAGITGNIRNFSHRSILHRGVSDTGDSVSKKEPQMLNLCDCLDHNYLKEVQMEALVYFLVYFLVIHQQLLDNTMKAGYSVNP